jgi:hypothetical protein
MGVGAMDGEFVAQSNCTVARLQILEFLTHRG